MSSISNNYPFESSISGQTLYNLDIDYSMFSKNEDSFMGLLMNIDIPVKNAEPKAQTSNISFKQLASCKPFKRSPKNQVSEIVSNNNMFEYNQVQNEIYATQLCEIDTLLFTTCSALTALSVFNAMQNYAESNEPLMNQSRENSNQNMRDKRNQSQEQNQRQNSFMMGKVVYDMNGYDIESKEFAKNFNRIMKKEIEERNQITHDIIDFINVKSFTFDLGDKSDKEWHEHAILFVVSYLKKKGYKYVVDEEKRYVTVTI